MERWSRMGEIEMNLGTDLNSEIIPKFGLAHRKKQVRRLILKEDQYLYINLEVSAKFLYSL